MSPDLSLVVVFFFVALVATLGVELLVALAFFGANRRALAAVAGVNLLTNPLFNFVLLVAAYTMGLGFVAIGFLPGPLTLVLEAAVVVAEWRLLVYVTRGTWCSSSELLWFSIIANLVSALAPVVLYLVVNFALVSIQQAVFR